MAGLVTLSHLTEKWLYLGGILTAPCVSNMLGVHDVAEARFGFWLSRTNRVISEQRAQSSGCRFNDGGNKFPDSFRIDVFGIRLRIRG